MNTPAKLGAFTLGLAVVFGLALGAGHVTGPIGANAEETPDTAHGGHDSTTAAAPAGSKPGGLPAGLLVSDRGYTLTKAPAEKDEFAFRVTGPDGRPVTAFDLEHDKRMHLIVVRRDLAGFQHVHPQMSDDGTWRVASPFGGPGTYRAFADFKPTGADPLVLGIDVTQAGGATPRPLPPPATTAAVDGYTLTLDGRLESGRTSKLTLSVSRDGKPVTDLQPYLAAYGHLVALRDGDLAYLHVHPDGAPGDGRTRPGPDITFFAEVPTAGTYRLYLDFQHEGKVRTAEFTAVAGDGPTSERPQPRPSKSASDDHGSDDHSH
ncbi:hypothetical protein [Actinomadura sp. HBU206391]|uniref:hypothetical protein n=1 Tax=Actinomadura sp. HBU206391 TaxID=2731692 RepID=UPI00164F9063|nr:hypothetical protein [Actinomadura sp. HBU206391]MBC6460155.1 hypothetical protein [Actinomadura sp. HBU206391]